eukprot:s1688_g7.t1
MTVAPPRGARGPQPPPLGGPSQTRPYDLFDPNRLVDFLVDADVRLVRLEYLVDLLESGKALPRRQEAEKERTNTGASALVAASELRQVDVNPETFHTSIMISDPVPRRLTVRFVSISHVWESMQHPDPWRFQLQSVVDKYRLRLADSVVWIFFDFLSLYQYDRDEDQDRVFKLGLHWMHLLYSHEAVEVHRIEALTSKELRDDCEAREGSSIPVYWKEEKKVMDISIHRLDLNDTPYSLRGWCQAERQWAALRTSIKGEFPVPLAPHIFRERMKTLQFTHREDSDSVFELHEKLFRQKAATTVQLLLEGLDVEKIADLAAALLSYTMLKEVVLTAIPEHAAWKVAAAVVESGACDVQIECDSFGDEEAFCLSAALSTEESQPLERLHLICDRLGETGRNALGQMMKHRKGHLVIESKDSNRGSGEEESEAAQLQRPSTTLRILVHRRLEESGTTEKMRASSSAAARPAKEAEFVPLNRQGEAEAAEEEQEDSLEWAAQDLCWGGDLRKHAVLSGHDQTVAALCKLDHDTLASAGEDYTVKLWSLTTKTCLHTFTEHTGEVLALCKLDLDTLASAGEDKTIKLWSLTTKTCLHTFTEHTAWVSALCKLDHDTLASAGADKTIKLWSLTTKTCLHTFTEHTGTVRALCKLDHATLTSAGEDKTIKLWSLKTKTCLHTFTEHTNWVDALCKLDHDTLASASFDKTIKLWSLTTSTCLHTFTVHTGAVFALCKLDHDTLASAGSDKTIKLWSLTTKTCLHTFTEHTDWVLALCKLGHDTLASAGADKTIVLWKGRGA